MYLKHLIAEEYGDITNFDEEDTCNSTGRRICDGLFENHFFSHKNTFTSISKSDSASPSWPFSAEQSDMKGDLKQLPCFITKYFSYQQKITE